MSTTFTTRNRFAITTEPVLQLWQECLGIVGAKGLPLPKIKLRGMRNNNTMYGICYSATSTRDCTIDINEALFSNLKECKRTMLHELGHAICDVEYPHERIGHGYEWKRVMHQITCDIGVDFSTRNPCGILNRKAQSEAAHMWKAVCQECGYTITRTRRGALVQHPEHYSCGYCGGKFKVTQVK